MDALRQGENFCDNGKPPAAAIQAFQGIPFKFRSSKSGLFINSQDSHCIPVCFSVPVCKYIILNTANRKSRNFGDCLRSEQEFARNFVAENSAGILLFQIFFIFLEF